MLIIIFAINAYSTPAAAVVPVDLHGCNYLKHNLFFKFVKQRKWLLTCIFLEPLW